MTITINEAMVDRRESRDYGIAEVILLDPFHVLMRSLLGTSSDLVGFYYSSGNREILVHLYDVYSGRLTTSQTTLLESVKKETNVAKVVTRRIFDHGGSNELLRERFHSALTKVLINRSQPKTVGREKDEMRRCIRQTLLRRMNLSNSYIPHNGYFIVNQMLVALSGHDYSLRKAELCDSLMSADFLSASIVSDMGNFSSYNRLDTAYQSELDMTFEIVKDIICTDPSSVSRLASVALASSFRAPFVEESDSPLLSSPEFREEKSMMYTISIPDDIDSREQRGSLHLESEFSERSEMVRERRRPGNIEFYLKELEIRPEQERSEKRSRSERDIASSREKVSEAAKEILEAEDQLLSSINEGDEEATARSLVSVNEIRFRHDHRQLSQMSIVARFARLRETSKVLKIFLADIFREMSRGEMVVFNLSEIANDLNSIFTLLKLDRVIARGGSLKEGSHQAVIVVGEEGIRSTVHNLTLSNGETLILPSNGADVSSLESSTLRAILQHLMSQSFTDKRFTGLKMAVTKEIASRAESERNERRAKLEREESERNEDERTPLFRAPERPGSDSIFLP